MVIDTSALIAILWKEPDYPILLGAIERDEIRLVSAVSLFETMMVAASRKGPAALAHVDRLIQDIEVGVCPFTPDQARLAQEAWLRFGKGRHPAGLNLGDCCSYSLSQYAGEALLYKSEDFSRTDIRSVLRPPTP